MCLGSSLSPVLQARHGCDADDASGADGDAGLHRGLVPDVQQTHLTHVPVAVTHPHLIRVLWTAVTGGGAGELHPAAGLHDGNGLQELGVPLVFVHGWTEDGKQGASDDNVLGIVINI